MQQARPVTTNDRATEIANNKPATKWLSLGDQAVVSAANFLTNVIVGRALLADDFGLYILAINLLYLAKGAQEALVAAPFVVRRQSVPGNQLKSYRASNALFHLTTVAGLLVAIPAFALLVAFWHGSSFYVQAALISLPAVPFLLTREYLRRVSFAEFRFELALCMDVAIAATQIAALLVGWWLGMLSPLLTLVAVGLACAMGAAIWMKTSDYATQLSWQALVGDWRADWSFGRWSCLTFLIGCSTPHLMPWLLASQHGEVPVARYGAAFTLVGLANLFILGVNNLLGPLAAERYERHGSQGLARLLTNTAAIFIAVLSGFCLLLWFYGDAVLTLLVGPKFPDSRCTMVILGGVMLGGALNMVAGCGLSAMQRPVLNLPSDGVMLFTSILAGIFLVPAYAEQGAAAAVLIGAGCASVTRALTLAWQLSKN